MQESETGETLKKICPTCGKRIAASRRSGSLTAYLFGSSDCNCSSAGGPQSTAQAALKGQDDHDSDFCPKCGLQIVTNSKGGSLTGFLFQSTRCKCPSDQAFADGKMSAKFWKLKQADSSTIFTSAAEKPSRGISSSIGLAPGAIIGGAYRIIDLIGRGGMGEVYLALHETLGKKCALKVIPPEQVTEMGWQRFQLEARAVAKLNHVNLVRVTDLGIHDGCLPFYAMDYVEGKNLAELLAEHGPMPLNTVLEIFMQVSDGIECAHRSGILHRDLKPANIMVSGTPSGVKQAKVLDFGLAKLTKSDRAHQSLTAVGDVFGSPFYMSPEQCNGDKLDNRTDVYSLGCTMFECLTGRPPFTGHLATAVIFGHLEVDPPTLESIVGQGGYSASMEIVMAKLLSKNPAERYQTLAELRGDLEAVAHGEDVQPFYVSRSKHMQRGAGSTESATSRQKGQSASNEPLFGARPLFEIDTTAEAGLAAPDRIAGLPLAWICSLAAIVAAFIVWAALSSFYARDQNQAVTKALIPQPTNAEIIIGRKETPEMVHARQVFDNCPQISHGLVNNGGTQARIFEFPEVPLGYICWGPGGQYKSVAQGRVIVPANAPVTLLMTRPESTYARMFPDVLAKIGPDDIYELEVKEPPTPLDDDLLSFELPVQLVRAVSKWRALHKINFYRCKIPKDSLLALNDLSSKIEELRLRGSPADGNTLAQVKWLNGLTFLDIKGINHVDSVLKALAGSPSINALCLDATAPSIVGLKALAICPNLKILDLGQAEIDDEKLPVVCDISSLKVLYLKGCNFTAKSIHQLTRLKKLTALNLDSVAIDEAAIERLRHEIPQCSITHPRKPLYPGVQDY